MLPLIPLEENIVLDQIGGGSAVNLVVDDFYERVFDDAILAPFFHNVDMDLLSTKMKAFLKMALGGPVLYTGKNVRQSHAHLVRIGLSDIHFDRVGMHLDHALKKYGVDRRMRDHIGHIVEQYRETVLNR